MLLSLSLYSSSRELGTLLPIAASALIVGGLSVLKHPFIEVTPN